MNREEIISEIQRVAKELGTSSLGREKFERMTGITEGSWSGKFWLRWSDAIAEAGLVPGKMTTAYDIEYVLSSIYALTGSLGRFPTVAEMKMQRRQDQSFPSHGAINRLGNRATLIGLVRGYAARNGDDSVRDLLASVASDAESEAEGEGEGEGSSIAAGHVYMMRLGRHFKIGRTYSVPRRHREIALELPQKPDVVHAIRTDDPEGIEAYWHRRFEARRTNGEWFALTPEEVKAFKRRKFM